MLRTRMDERAETLARQALPLQLVGLSVLVAGALVGWSPLALAGLLGYVAGLIWWGRALIRPLRAHGLREFAPASVLAALRVGGS
jgi:nitrite reductase (NO-forming)